MTITGLGALASSNANACSITATRKPLPFKSTACEGAIRKLISFANEAHSKSDDEISDWQERTGIAPSFEGEAWSSDGYLKEMRISDGKSDTKLMRVGELTLIRNLKNKATYVFTIKRNQYFAADEEGCNGLFTHDEYFAATETAFLATFENNEFKSFKEFPEWYV